MEELKKAYKEVEQSLLRIIPEFERFVKAILEIDIQQDEYFCKGFYFNGAGYKKQLDMKNFVLDKNHINDIRNIITSMGDKTSEIQKFICKIFSGGNLEIDFVWQERVNK
jgi:hypothetical protein